jgi:hypothetical protein
VAAQVDAEALRDRIDRALEIVVLVRLDGPGLLVDEVVMVAVAVGVIG